ncbi:MAG: hypothetical protein D6692_10580 [Planctomycetota bacterium]|nr:MAG: hypothetical protein D6692_10580 [Planctomycetota bacterium]
MLLTPAVPASRDITERIAIMTKVITAIFESHADTARAVKSLASAGFGRDQIRFITSEQFDGNGFGISIQSNRTYELLTESLREERSADSSLTDLAEHSINRLAMPAAK